MKIAGTDSLLKITYAHRREGARGYGAVEVSRALVALNTDFKQWIKKQRHNDETNRIPHHSHLGLTITSIDEGSVCLGFDSDPIVPITIFDIARIVAPTVTDAATQMLGEIVKDWGNDLAKVLRKMSRKGGRRSIEPKDRKKYKNILGGQTMHIKSIDTPGSNNTFNYQQITNIYNNLEEAPQSREDTKEKVLMTIVEADKGPRRGLMARVEEIESDPKPLIVPRKFIDDGYFSWLNDPLAKTFEVDLKVIKKDDEIIRYRLLEIHGESLGPDHIKAPL